MLRETAEELQLTPYITDFRPPNRYIDPEFYEDLEHDDDPPIYRMLLMDFREANDEIALGL